MSGCGVCMGHSPSWDGHDINCPVRVQAWKDKAAEAEIAHLRESRGSEARRAGAAEHEVDRLTAEMVKMGRDHAVRLQVRDQEEERLRAELAERDLIDSEASSPFPKGYWIERCDYAEAAIARVRELWTSHGLAVPPEIERALDGAGEPPSNG